MLKNNRVSENTEIQTIDAPTRINQIAENIIEYNQLDNICFSVLKNVFDTLRKIDLLKPLLEWQVHKSIRKLIKDVTANKTIKFISERTKQPTDFIQGRNIKLFGYWISFFNGSDLKIIK